MLRQSTFLILVLLAHTSSAEQEVVSFEEMNRFLGIELFADNSLWDDVDKKVAKRLEWPLEGRTSTRSSYRLYPGEDYTVLDTRTYSAALYCIDAKPDRISLMFSNKGDYPYFKSSFPPREVIKAFEEQLELEEDRLVSILTGLLGEPEKGKMGKGKRIRERLQRWDWNGHAILLSVQDGEYVSLRITRPEFADNRGITESISDNELRELLKERVVRRDNGDVIISEIPMADQGPKGYCVPASWERYLRYLGIPADMYVLARAGSSGYGGGTYIHTIAEAVDDLAGDFSRKLDDTRAELEPRKIAKYIDQGLPLMWAVYAGSHLYMQGINDRTDKRSQVTDWQAWNEQLEPAREAVEDMNGLRTGGHVCIIIGYNEETREIATSDSWGKQFIERWMTVEEAEALSQGHMQLVRW
ncbi:MAG: hypothetical protein AAGH72_03690 [Verrucomicrobiota bacterium]